MNLMEVKKVVKELKKENDEISILYNKKELELKNKIIDEIYNMINEFKEVLRTTKDIGLTSCEAHNLCVSIDRNEDTHMEESTYIKQCRGGISLDRKDLERATLEYLKKLLNDFNLVYKPAFYKHIESCIESYKNNLQKKREFLEK